MQRETEQQRQHLADLAVEARQAIARAPREAYEYWELHPEREQHVVRLEWERAVYLNRLQELLRAVETSLGLPAQNLPEELFGPSLRPDDDTEK